jgi:tellurite resistance protein TehA-like permease
MAGECEDIGTVDEARVDHRGSAAGARQRALGELFPGYFALVMATGIIAVGASQQHIRWLAWTLLWAAAGFYLALWVLYVLRLAWFRERFVNDLTSHQRGPSFLTMVAGTNVLGSAFLLIADWRTVGLVLWVLGVVLWAVLFYAVLTSITVLEPKPDLAGGINGAWLVLVVGTESVGVLAALLAAGSGHAAALLFVALSASMVGLLVYLIVIGLVSLRWWFAPMASEQATPPYWINMGALAITTLGLATIFAARAQGGRTLEAFGPFLAGMTVLVWAWASWWIPLLVIIGVWRHLFERVPLRYDPQFWSLVFPLGMYGAATYRMATALQFAFLDWLPKVFLGIALLAWALTLVGMLRTLVRVVSARA